MYVKLFASLLESSVWAEDAPTRLVWITLLLMADRDGFVRGSPSGLARRANVGMAECRKAMATLEAPDVESGTDAWGGRRIERVAEGWQILNYMKYRDLADTDVRRQQVREAVQRHRQRKASVIIGNQPQAHAEAEVEATTPPLPAREPEPSPWPDFAAAPETTFLPARYLPALDRAMKASRNPGQVESTVRDAIASPTSTMPKHCQFAPEIVGQALEELLATGPFSPAGLRTFCQRLVRERSEPPKAGGNGRRETQQERNLRVIRETTAAIIAEEAARGQS